MPQSDVELGVSARAIEFACRNKKPIARKLTDPAVYPPDAEPVSVFMAGSPGAGKTEASKELLNEFSADKAILRIDPDELRAEFTDYDGSNAWLFQGAASILVEKVLDFALDQSQSFVLDGTLSHYDVAERNIKRSLRKGRVVQILYVYQEPRLAWEFVQAREAKEGRRVPPEQFVDQYFAARETVNRLKREFGADIRVDLLLKNNDGSNRFYRNGVDQIDYHIPEKYDRNDVLALVGLMQGRSQ